MSFTQVSDHNTHTASKEELESRVKYLENLLAQYRDQFETLSGLVYQIITDGFQPEQVFQLHKHIKAVALDLAKLADI